MENKEICDLVKIMGLQYKKKYQSQEDMKSLRSDMKLVLRWFSCIRIDNRKILHEIDIYEFL